MSSRSMNCLKRRIEGGAASIFSSAACVSGLIIKYMMNLWNELVCKLFAFMSIQTYSWALHLLPDPTADLADHIYLESEKCHTNKDTYPNLGS